MGLLDYYRQFDDMDQEEVNQRLREKRRLEKEQELQVVVNLDLATTEWPDFPNAEVMNQAIFAARGRVNGYPDRHAMAIRGALAKRHELDPEQIVFGNGATELLQEAAHLLLSPGDELVTHWPSYPLFPLMAARAGARPVAVDAAGGAADPEAMLAAVTERTKVMVVCNPNDPTGDYLPAQSLRWLLGEVPEHVHVLLDEAFVHFQDIEPIDSCLGLVNEFPRLLVFRTFSKVYGMAGLRAGYVVGSTQASRELEGIAPPLGVNALTQAGIQHALKLGDAEVERRRNLVIEQRKRILSALHDLPVDAPPSQANFVWLSAPGMSGVRLGARLEEEGVIVAPGGPLGAEDHVRASVRGAAATERLLGALEKLR
jgi:histidinol-phosphate aminotransferase